MKNIMKKFALCCLLCSVCFLSIGCNMSTQDLYKHGIYMTSMLDLALNNEEYKDLQGINEDVSKYLSKDYDTPESVFKINIPSNEELIKFYKNYDKVMVLPDDLKESYIDRYDFNIVINTIIYDNCKSDDIWISISLGVFEFFEGTIDKSEAFLFIYETGQPIITYFMPSGSKIQSIAYFLPIENVRTLSGARNLFEQYGCQVEKYI